MKLDINLNKQLKDKTTIMSIGIIALIILFVTAMFYIYFLVIYTVIGMVYPSVTIMQTIAVGIVLGWFTPKDKSYVNIYDN